MPKSKVPEQPFFLKNWRPITAIASAIILLSGLAVVATEQYNQGQISAASAAETAIELGEQQIDEVTARVDDLELAIRNAEQLLADTEDQTLDEVARDALLAEIEIAKETWVAQKTKLLELEAAVSALRKEVKSEQIARATLNSLIETVAERSKSNLEKIISQVSAIGSQIAAVQSAQALWEKEQEVIAAEETARVADEAASLAKETAERLERERNIAPVSTLTDSGGSTSPSAPAPPAEEVAAAPVQQGVTNREFIISYVVALAPNSFISWVDGLCDGYYVCGRAWVGGSNTNPVRIELDPALEEIYINSVGISVLVHEAAHARQWFKYGSEIITANEVYTGLVGTIAVEYMADCATIVKLGYSTNVYTGSCSQAQLDTAATIW